MNKIRELGGKPELRMAEKKAGPVITDNGTLPEGISRGVRGVRG